MVADKTGAELFGSGFVAVTVEAERGGALSFETGLAGATVTCGVCAFAELGAVVCSAGRGLAG